MNTQRIVNFSPALPSQTASAIDLIADARAKGEQVILSVCECGCVRMHLHSATCEVLGKTLPPIEFTSDEMHDVTGLRWFVRQLAAQDTVICVSQDGSREIQRAMREGKKYLLVDPEEVTVVYVRR